MAPPQVKQKSNKRDVDIILILFHRYRFRSEVKKQVEQKIERMKINNRKLKKGENRFDDSFEEEIIIDMPPTNEIKQK